MNGIRDFLDELVHTDSVTKVLLDHKKQTVQLALIIVAALMAVLLLLHHNSTELTVSTDSEENGQTYEQDQGLENGQAAEDGGEAGDRSIAGIDTDGIIYVDVGGAVKHPMLAELKSGSRVEDAIEAAGGLKDDADLSQINRAAILNDGEKIYIPAEGEEAAAAGSSGTTTDAGQDIPGISSGRININTADETLLQQLTGVGPVTAQKIIDYREENGNFKSIEDLKNVSGIGDKTFEKTKDDITI